MGSNARCLSLEASSNFDKLIVVPKMSTVKIKIPILSIFVFLHKKGVPVLSTLDKIILLLKEQGKKQIELCEYIGVKKNAFTSWKAGVNHSYKKHIDKIAEFLGVSTDYLLGTQKQESPAADSNEVLAFALYGGDRTDITPAMLDKVREFARFVRDEERRKNNDVD